MLCFSNSRSLLLIALVLSLISLESAQAQSITAADDGTGTTVSQNDNQYDITGGSLSGDGDNLFHSFEQFGLTAAEVANIIADPTIQNILGRVTGGDASIIDGLLRVSGSDANLFLINPAGILFGPNASLDLTGSFTAATATGIGFEDTWLNAFGPNDYATLVGNPASFAFAVDQPGAILNDGDLAVSPSQTLTLVGGAVINTGTLTASGGQITVASVSGQSLVRISHENMVLNLELATLVQSPLSLPPSFTPLDLPSLLTAGNNTHATDITVNPDGTVSLTGSGLAIALEPGTTLVSGTLDAGCRDVACNVSTASGGTIQVLGDQVGLLAATVDASGTNGGGTVLVGGDYQGQGSIPNASHTYVGSDSVIDASALGTGDGGRIVVWANETTQFYGEIIARAGIEAGNGGFVEVSGLQALDFHGQVDTSAFNGNVGTLLLDPIDITVVDSEGNTTSTILLFEDPPEDAFISASAINTANANVILQATNDITFDAPVNISSLGVGLTAEAGNTITVNESITTQGGDITLISSNGSITTTDLNTSVVGEGDSGAITLDAGSSITTANLNSSAQAGDAGAITFNAGDSINTGDIFADVSNPFFDAGAITFNAGDSINTGDIFADVGGSSIAPLGNAGMVMLAAGGSINTGDIDTSSEEGDSGAITLNAGDSITTADLDSSANSGNAGVITLDAGDSINTGDIFTFTDLGNAGMVMLAAGDSINTVNINTSSEEGDGGAITLNASGNITTADLDSSANSGNAGVITLDAGDSINTGDIYAHVFDDSGDGGAVMLAAGGGINTVDINTSSNEGDSGAITLNASGGITIADLDSSAALGNAGAITLNASDSITTADIDTGSDSGFGGPVILTSEMGAITTGMINTAGATGGDVVLNAETAITTGAIDTRGTDGDAGDVILDPSGDVQVIYINAESGGGVGGAITVVTEQFFRATGSFVAQNGLAASISSIGTQGVGDITITHGGGLLGVPFTIGDATTNGTAAAITSGNFTLDASNPNNPFLDSFNLGETAPGNIDLITAAAAAPSLSPNSLDPCFGDCATPRIPELFGDEEVDGRLQLVQAPLTVLPETYAANAFQRFETRFTREFVDYLELDETPESITISQAQTALQNIQSQTGENPALLFVVFGASGTEKTITEETITEHLSSNYRDLNPLELLLLTADEDPVYVSVPEATRRQVLTMAQRLRRQVTNPYRVGTTTYLFSAQALYRWLIAPIQADLEEREITNIGFIMDSGLRSAPLAALHDGQRFLVENYSIGLIPSLGLIDTTYVNIQNAQALVGGASEFIDQNPLPFEPVEIETIQTLWPGQQLQNEDFTVDNLQAQRQQRPYGIIHLSTHGKFSPGALSKSYIQFFDGKLQLDQLRKLGWNDPPVELVTLSACQTALGNREAELGFAGLAVLAGTKSALASLWQVGDEATTGLMVEFYQQLQTAPTKVEALRQAQLAMINGQVLIEANQLRWTGGSIRLPPALLSEVTATLSHPFHWAAFTLVGSPW